MDRGGNGTVFADRKRNRQIFDMWMACYTQEDIAVSAGVTHQAVHEILQKSAELPEVAKPLASHLVDFTAPIYNVWTWPRERPPYGLGKPSWNEARVQALAEGARPLGEHGTNQHTERGRSDNYLLGRGADYLTARIARDRPDVLERMKAGEFKSARQAAIAATRWPGPAGASLAGAGGRL